MQSVSTFPPGSFCWVDLNSHDMAASIEWYGALLGWTCEQVPSPGGRPPYGMFSVDGEVVAGIGEMSAEMKAQGVGPTWNSYVCVESAQATHARVEALGGKVIFAPHEIPGSGVLAFFADPHGAIFAVWQPAEHGGAAAWGKPGSCCWNELASRDVAASQAFYGALFGWRYRTDAGQPVAYTEILAGDRVVGGMLAIKPEWGDMPPSWSVYFAVREIETATAAVASSGGKVYVPNMKVEGVGTFSVVADPQGGSFCLIQLAPRPA